MSKEFKAFFRDLESGTNLVDGKEYHAAGIITNRHNTNCKSLKDVVVMYLDPFTGSVCHEWRADSDIVIYECDEISIFQWEDTKKILESLDNE